MWNNKAKEEVTWGDLFGLETTKVRGFLFELKNKSRIKASRWRIIVSLYNRSLTLEESEQTYVEFDTLLEVMQLSIGSSSYPEQSQAVKVKGTITVSFW